MALVRRGNSTYRYEKGKYIGKVSGPVKSKRVQAAIWNITGLKNFAKLGAKSNAKADPADQRMKLQKIRDVKKSVSVLKKSERAFVQRVFNNFKKK